MDFAFGIVPYGLCHMDYAFSTQKKGFDQISKPKERPKEQLFCVEHNIGSIC